MDNALIEPGKLDAKAIIPSPLIDVYLFWKMESPENILPKAFPIPPFVDVSIFIFGLIQLIDPRSVIIVSPCATWQTTTGNGSPCISYLITNPPSIMIRI